MSGPLLEIDQLRTWLDLPDGVVRAVDGLSLRVEPGETFALLGESGCGKSITALSIMRLLPETGRIINGHIRLMGTDLLTLPETEMRQVRGGRIGMIFQEPMLSLNPVMTIGEQVSEVLLQHHSLPRKSAAQQGIALLDSVGIPEAARRSAEYPFQLSGGQKQRVMIAMALACGPDLLIADEPTTALDVTIQAQVLQLLRERQQQTRLSVLLITHDLGVVSEMAHRVAVMYAGEIVESAGRAQFFTGPAHPYSRKLFDSLPSRNKRDKALSVIRGGVPPLTRLFTGCRFFERCDHAWDRCQNAPPPWIEGMDGHGVRCHLYGMGARGEISLTRDSGPVRMAKDRVLSDQDRLKASISRPNDPSSILNVENLRVYFPVRKGFFKRMVGQVKAVDGVSFSIPYGKTMALVGESGCGKTTVGKGILRLIPVTEGSIGFQERDLTKLSRVELRPLRRELQIIFQDPYASLNPRMRVKEIIEEGMTALGIGSGPEDRVLRIIRLLEEVGLPLEAQNRYPHEFSGGQRQRIAIARALSVTPKLVICDEPTSALDISVQAQILNLLKGLQDRHGLSYLFITHNISVVEFLAHEVMVMYLGRIVEQGRVEEVLNRPRHPYTRALLSAVPVIDQGTKEAVIRLSGDLPSPMNPPAGCHFHPRCPEVRPLCRERYPASSRFSKTHSVHCHLYEALTPFD
jgi:peptide/nickel transport system ATP-binding protein